MPTDLEIFQTINDLPLDERREYQRRLSRIAVREHMESADLSESDKFQELEKLICRYAGLLGSLAITVAFDDYCRHVRQVV